jgi:hypothetical protein
MTVPAGFPPGRAAEEALTSTARHAPGAAPSVLLGFESREVTVSVCNSPVIA